MPGAVDTPMHGDRREKIRAWAEYMTGDTLVVGGGLVAV